MIYDFEYSTNQGIKLLEKMLVIRESELLIAEMSKKNYFKTPIHLAIGQEAIAAGIFSNLNEHDYVYGNHRSHSHYLASGAPLFKLFAEILGRTDGCSGGKGGSMHISAVEKGFIGAMPIVAGTIPLAVGAALTAKLNNSKKVAVSFFGDGATEEGVFHESLNFAAVKSLPILFVCENNSFSSHLHISERQKSSEIIRFAEAQRIENFVVDGNDVEIIKNQSKYAIDLIRNQGLPVFIEAKTYRMCGHVGAELDLEIGLNRFQDYFYWMEKDPIKIYSEKLLDQGQINKSNLSELFGRIKKYVLDQWFIASKSNFPETSELTRNIYLEKNDLL